jgi:hypothetical protein
MRNNNKLNNKPVEIDGIVSFKPIEFDGIVSH